jgi:hypothetical protein
LYNLKNDIGQQDKLAISSPEKFNEMILVFEATIGKEYFNIEQLELK